MSDTLKGLFGGGEDANEPVERRREVARDFVRRYTTGDPTEGYSSDEAMERFRQVTRHASPEQLRRAARRTVENLPEQQRAEFNQMLQQRQAGQGLVEIQRTGDGGQPAAQATDPLGGLLGGLLGGAGGGGTGGLDDLLGGLLGGGGPQRGEASPQPGGTQRGGGMDDLFGGLGDLMSNPVGKAIIGGIAAFALKEMVDQN